MGGLCFVSTNASAATLVELELSLVGGLNLAVTAW